MYHVQMSKFTVSLELATVVGDLLQISFNECAFRQKACAVLRVPSRGQSVHVKFNYTIVTILTLIQDTLYFSTN